MTTAIIKTRVRRSAAERIAALQAEIARLEAGKPAKPQKETKDNPISKQGLALLNMTIVETRNNRNSLNESELMALKECAMSMPKSRAPYMISVLIEHKGHMQGNVLHSLRSAMYAQGYPGELSLTDSSLQAQVRDCNLFFSKEGRFSNRGGLPLPYRLILNSREFKLIRGA